MRTPVPDNYPKVVSQNPSKSISSWSPQSAEIRVECQRLGEQFLLARRVLADVVASRDANPPPYGGRVDEMIAFLTELRSQTGKAFSSSYLKILPFREAR